MGAGICSLEPGKYWVDVAAEWSFRKQRPWSQIKEARKTRHIVRRFWV